MKAFKEKETPIQNIAYLGVLCAIVALFTLVIEFVPFSALPSMLFIPLISVFATACTKEKYNWIYLVSALLVSFIVSINNYIDTLFYVFPPLISGFFYGYLRKKGCPTILLIFASASLTMGLHYLSIPLIRAIYQIDMIPSTLKLLGLDKIINILYVVPSFIFSLSLGEFGLSFLIIELIEKRIGDTSDDNHKFLYVFLSLFFSITTMLFAFYVPSLAFLSLVISFYFGLASTLFFLTKGKYYNYVLLIVFLISSLFLFAYFYKKMPMNTGLTLISLPIVAFDLSNLLIGLQYTRKEKNHD